MTADSIEFVEQTPRRIGSNEEKMYLITTSDERTWKFDRPIIFLNHKCLNPHRNHIWNDLDYKVFEDKTSIGERKKIVISQKKTLETDLFDELVTILNTFHMESFSKSFWQILIGHWYEIYLCTFLEREYEIKSIINSNVITGASFINLKDLVHIPRDLTSMIEILENPTWQSSIDFIIVSNMSKFNFPIEIIGVSEEKKFTQKVSEKLPKYSRLGTFLKILHKKISYHLTRNNEAYINSTYLPRFQEILLNLSYFQLPKSWRYFLQYSDTATPDLYLRKTLSDKLKNGEKNNLIRNELFNFIPTCYLEGFSQLHRKTQALKLPKSPKFIFTSNDFQSYEVFKMYTAISTENKVRYFVGQHGSQYGTNKFSDPMIEERTSDKFITWGWSSVTGKHIPGFVLKTAGQSYKNNPAGGLLLVLYPIGVNSSDFATVYDPNLFLANQKQFIESLNPTILQELTLRFHRGSTNTIESDIAKFQKYHSILSIEKGLAPIKDLISNNRLTVFSYDSTGMLENLSLNIPTLAFWQFEMQHLTEDAKGYYQLLVDAGIVHFNPESIANKVNEIWSDVEAWWQLPVVQIAREKFCSQYAKASKKPIRDLRKIIRENLTN